MDISGLAQTEQPAQKPSVEEVELGRLDQPLGSQASSFTPASFLPDCLGPVRKTTGNDASADLSRADRSLVTINDPY